MFDRTIKLKELYEITGYNHEEIRVICARDGRILITHYDPKKHEKFDNLEVGDMSVQMYFLGGTNHGGGDVVKTRLLVWAREDDYIALKEAEE